MFNILIQFLFSFCSLLEIGRVLVSTQLNPEWLLYALQRALNYFAMENVLHFKFEFISSELLWWKLACVWANELTISKERGKGTFLERKKISFWIAVNLRFGTT